MLLAALIVAVLAAGVTGVAIHHRSTPSSAVAAPPTTEAPTTAPATEPSTSAPPGTAAPTSVAAPRVAGTAPARRKTATRPRSSALGVRTRRSNTQRLAALPSTGWDAGDGLVPASALALAGLLLRRRLRLTP